MEWFVLADIFILWYYKKVYKQSIKENKATKAVIKKGTFYYVRYMRFYRTDC